MADGTDCKIRSLYPADILKPIADRGFQQSRLKMWLVGTSKKLNISRVYAIHPRVRWPVELSLYSLDARPGRSRTSR